MIEVIFKNSTPTNFLILISTKCTVDDFIEASGVHKGSYAEEIVVRLYRALITCSQDLCKEHMKYYSEEYPDIRDFLFWKYAVPIDVGNEFCSSISADETLRYGTLTSGGDYRLGNFLEEETFYRSLVEIVLKVRRKFNENTD